MTEIVASPSAGAEPPAERLQPAYLSHVSLPVRDRRKAIRFFVDVLGAELIDNNEKAGFSEVRLAGTVFGLAERPGGWTAPDAEYPHYAFEVRPEDFEPLKARLDAHGVKTHPIWTRHGVEALMYFRDPSGNPFEFFCTRGFKDADRLPVARSAGGDYHPPIADLSYDWNG
jgi:catechol 2,3-dioxygenase-like lactoylglutathione lyase family enzyme